MVGKRVHDFRGDDFKPVRDLLVQIVGELEALDPAALSLLLSRVESEMVPRLGQGENTLAWRRGEAPMRRNRGHL